MANEIKRYTLDISNVTENGVACDNPTVTILSTTSNVAVNCIEGCSYEVSSLENLQDQCITFLVECEDCGSCPAEEVTVCFCSNDDDCGACEKCEDGICVSRCPDKFCKNDVCVDCLDNNDCPDGFVCTVDGCICPSGIVVDGRCVECDSSTPLENCQVCVDGQIVAQDCGSLNCNPKTGICQECVDNSHCSSNTDGRTCCKSGKCSCCDGFQFDEVLGKCVEKPKCIDSEDCGPCEDCNGGICVPRECPEDYVCNPETDDCEYNPCPNQPCENGAECGPDCGCGADGFCKPCSELSCNNNDCANTLGCGCVGANCAPTGGCSGSCDNGYDCGPGCTCYKGECVSCSNFSCTDNDCDNRPGCECNAGKCGPGGPGTSNNACLDKFELKKDVANCNLTANLRLQKGCPCSTITAAVIPTSNEIGDNYVTTVTVNLHKGQGDPSVLPRLGDTSNSAIADNEKPLSGTIALDLITTYEELNSNGQKIAEKTVKTSNIGGVLGFSGVDTNTTDSFNIPAIGSFIDPGTDRKRVLKNELVVRQSGNFDFPNTCTYSDIKEIYRYTITANGWAEQAIAEMVTDDTRVPRFTWYRSEDNVFSASEIIRDLYITTQNAGFFSDTLYGPDNWTPGSKQILAGDEGLLIPNRYYQVINDCSCNPAVSSDIMFFCASDIQNLNEPTLTNCGRKVTLVGNPQVCNVNQDLTQFDDIDGQPYDIDLSVRWRLYVNDELITTFRHDKASNQLKTVAIAGETVDTSNGLSFSGYNYTAQEAIRSLRIEQNNGNCIKEFEFDNETIIPEIATSCENANGTITAKFAIAGYVDNTVTATAVSIFGETPTTDGNFIIFSNLSSDKVYTYTATFSNGCTYTDTFVDSCCQEELFTVEENCKTDGTVDVTVLPNVQGVSIEVTDDFVSYTPSNGVYNLPNGRYTVIGRLNDECVKEEVIRPNCCEAGTIKIDSVTASPFCSSDGATVKVTGTPGVQFTLGFITTAVVPVVGNVEVCNPFASNQVIPASGVALANLAPGYYEAVAGTTGEPIDITFRLCSVSNPGTDCEVEIEVEQLNSVVYPEIQVVSESTSCNNDATEWTLTLTTQYANSAVLTSGTGSLNFANNIVTVSGIPSGESVTLTFTGASGVCNKTYTKSLTCNCTPPVTPVITGDLTYCEGDPLPSQTATNSQAGYTLQVSTNGTDWTSLGGFTYTPPSAGTYYFRYFIPATNCPGQSVTRVISLDATPIITSTELLDSCTKLKMVLSGNHIVGTTTVLYNSADCSSNGTSLTNPQINGNIVTYTIPASVTLNQTSWSVKYGECSCKVIDTVTSGCDQDCDCTLELIEDPDNNCNLRVLMNDGVGEGCSNYDLLEIRDSLNSLIYSTDETVGAPAPGDNYQEDIGPEGNFESLLGGALNQGNYTATLTGVGCPTITASHSLVCDCDPDISVSVDSATCDGGGPLCGAELSVVDPNCEPTCSNLAINVSGITQSEFDNATMSFVQNPGGMTISLTSSAHDQLLFSVSGASGTSCGQLTIVEVNIYACGSEVPAHTFQIAWVNC